MEKQQRQSPNQIKFRTTDEELNQITANAQTFGLSVTAFAKMRTLDGGLVTPKFSNEEARGIMLQLQKWGTNLNQIARQINSGIREGFNDQFQFLGEQLRLIRKTISESNGDR